MAVENSFIPQHIQTSRSSDAHGGSHTVEFYEDTDVFLERLSVSMATALRQGGVCLVIATDSHRQGLAQRIRNSGVDLALAVRNNQYLLLDAQATLTRFMVDGQPDRDLFFDTIEPLLLRAKATLGPNASFPVAFGEMVAVLWDEGKYEAAVQLEQLWNELSFKHLFALHCAYPRKYFTSGPEHQALFDRICGEHTHVFPTAASQP